MLSFVLCSQVEMELGLLFSEGRKRGLGIGNKAKQTRGSTNFNMFVEDIREGVLVSIYDLYLLYIAMLLYFTKKTGSRDFFKFFFNICQFS